MESLDYKQQNEGLYISSGKKKKEQLQTTKTLDNILFLCFVAWMMKDIGIAFFK